MNNPKSTKKMLPCLGNRWKRMMQNLGRREGVKRMEWMKRRTLWRIHQSRSKYTSSHSITRSKKTTALSTKLLRIIRKQRWLPQPLDWDIFDFSSATAEWHLMKLNRKQVLKVLYQVCVFGPIAKKVAAWPLIGKDLFWVLLCNGWTEFDKTWLDFLC